MTPFAILEKQADLTQAIGTGAGGVMGAASGVIPGAVGGAGLTALLGAILAKNGITFDNDTGRKAMKIGTGAGAVTGAGIGGLLGARAGNTLSAPYGRVADQSDRKNRGERDSEEDDKEKPKEQEKEAMTALRSGLSALGRGARNFKSGVGGGFSDVIDDAAGLIGRGGPEIRYRHMVRDPTMAHAMGYGTGAAATAGLPAFAVLQSIKNLRERNSAQAQNGPYDALPLGRNGVHPDLEKLWAQQGYDPNNNPTMDAYRQAMRRR